jgi:HD-GYP domain-containing protein (c-di-GMP phosphodiesterase class II)
MTDFTPIRKSQAFHYLTAPLYIKNEAQEYVLYKSANADIDLERFYKENCPQLYIPNDHRAQLYDALQREYHVRLAERLKSGDTRGVKNALGDIVAEALQEPLKYNLQTLPETIEIIYREYAYTTKLLKSVTSIKYGGTSLVEHTVNTMLLVLNYCIFQGFSEEKTKPMSLGALVHDVGLARIPERITQSRDKLSALDFKIYRTHPVLGHEIIVENMDVDRSVAAIALEHHEKLDGTGYPVGTEDISYEGRLFGIIDAFEQLTFNEKAHRKRREPFGALNLIQSEILSRGNYDREIFKGVCLSLVGKSRFD